VDYCDKKVTLMLLCALQMGAINDPLCRQDGENDRHFHSFRCRSQPETFQIHADRRGWRRHRKSKCVEILTLPVRKRSNNPQASESQNTSELNNLENHV
jgi:hypothetical protein